jgi:hypothetical protein
MKKHFLALLISIISLTVFAQDTTNQKKIYRNEFGVDATGFIKQFLNFNQTQFPDYYTPTYYLTYRRHFSGGNIRFGIGGTFLKQDIAAPFTGDSNSYHSSSYSFDARIGWEFFSKLSKRWQAFYGLDFKPSIYHSKNDAPYWNGGYANGIEVDSKILGLGSVLGFRFKLTNRISLTTETSFSLFFENTSTRKYFIPVTNQFPAMADVVTPDMKKIYGSYSQPLSVIFTFDI